MKLQAGFYGRDVWLDDFEGYWEGTVKMNVTTHFFLWLVYLAQGQVLQIHIIS